MITPSPGTRPKVGLYPTMPQRAAGTRTEARVSVAMAPRLMPVATAMADPPLEPPGLRVLSQGLRLCGVVTPSANSCVWVLPVMMAPAVLSARMLLASLVSTRSTSTGELAVLGMPATASRSLTAIGDAAQWAAAAAGTDIGVDRRGRQQQILLWRHIDKGVQLRLPPPNCIQRLLHDGDGRQGAGGNSVCRLGERQRLARKRLAPRPWVRQVGQRAAPDARQGAHRRHKGRAPFQLHRVGVNLRHCGAKTCPHRAQTCSIRHDLDPL